MKSYAGVWSAEELTRSTGVPFLVGFFFSFRLFIMLFSIYVLGTEPQTGTAITLGLNLFLPLLVALQCLGTEERSVGSMLRLWPIRWTFIFLGFSGCSLLWTVAASLPMAIAYWCGMVADVLMVVLLLRTGAIPETAHALIRGYIWGACAVALCACLLPTQSDSRIGREELLWPNQIGYVCALALFFAQYLIRRKDGAWRFATALLAVTLLRTLNKTTLIAFVVAEAFLLIKDRSVTRRTKVMLLSAIVFVSLAFSNLLVSHYVISAGNSSETLTGRLHIWAAVLNQAVKHPLFGHGFYSVWKVMPPIGAFGAPYANNELLQQFYAYGAVGIVMLIGLYGSFYRHFRKLEGMYLRSFCFAFLLFALIRGIAETEAFELSLPLWAIIMLSLCIQYTMQHNDPEVADRPYQQLDLTPKTG